MQDQASISRFHQGNVAPGGPIRAPKTPDPTPPPTPQPPVPPKPAPTSGPTPPPTPALTFAPTALPPVGSHAGGFIAAGSSLLW